MKVPFLDLGAQHARLSGPVHKAVTDLLRRSDFVLGEQVRLFERDFASYCGTKHAVGLNSGTDALFLSLIGLGIGEADEVIVPAFTFIATANAVSYTGARPVFVDIDETTYNIDVSRIEEAITKKTKAIIPVHLFGQCCDMAAIMRIARKHGLKVIEDACQAHGAVYYPKSPGHLDTRSPGFKAGAMGEVGCFSFYPTKNLGGWGDGGMVVTNDRRIFKKLMMLRDCGRTSRYKHDIVGYNSRLDTIQAAMLRCKLPMLDKWNAARARHACRYDGLLGKITGVQIPLRAPYSSHVFHVYAIRVRQRDRLVEHLKKNSIGVMVHYPIPLHLQKAYKALGYRSGDFPVAEKVSRQIISLPMHPFLTKQQIHYVARSIQSQLEE